MPQQKDPTTSSADCSSAKHKERACIFKDDAVRAILDGSKTQHRSPIVDASDLEVLSIEHDELDAWMIKSRPVRKFGELLDAVFPSKNPIFTLSQWHRIRCPFGRVGDRLWVQEVWGVMFDEDAWKQSRADVHYRATDPSFFETFKGRPSSNMSKWASRITLEITGIRVERLQEISEEDAKAEGCEREWDDLNDERDPETGYFPPSFYASGFERLWDRINAKRGYPWASNPWVWVIEFRRIA